MKRKKCKKRENVGSKCRQETTRYWFQVWRLKTSEISKEGRLFLENFVSETTPPLSKSVKILPRGKKAKALGGVHFSTSILLQAVLLFLPLFLSAQNNLQPNFRNYSMDDGLPSNNFHSFAQDSKGYIWLGSVRGVTRFDGYEFKNFGLAEGLPANFIL